MVKKKIGAIMLLICMIATLLLPQTFVMAATGDGKANLSLVYLGSSNLPATTAQALPAEAPAVNSTFWVGLQFSEMSDLRDMFGSATKGDTGLNNFIWTVLYDSAYLTPTITAASTVNGVMTKVYRSNFPAVVVVDEILETETTEEMYQATSLNTAGELGLTGAGTEANELNAATTKSFSYMVALNTETTTYKNDTTSTKENVPKIFQDKVAPFADSTVGADPVVMAAAQFKVTNDATGKKVLQLGLAQNALTLGLGNTGAGDGKAYMWHSNTGTDAEINLKNKFNITDKDGTAVTSYVLNLFGAGAASVDGIEITGDLTTKIQYTGQAIDAAGLTAVYTMSDGSPPSDSLGTPAWYYAPSTATVDSATDTDLVPITTAPTTAGTYYLYAVGKGQYAQATVSSTPIELTIAADSIESITVVENTIPGQEATPSKVYGGDKINPINLTANVKMASEVAAGGSGTNVQFGIPFDDKGVALYRITKALSDNDVYEKVDYQTTEYSIGVNTFVVGTVEKDADGTPKVESAQFTITALANKLELQASSQNAAKTSYETGNKFDPSGIVVEEKKLSESTWTPRAYASFGTDPQLEVVIAADETAAQTAAVADASTDITDVMLGLTGGNPYKIYVRVKADPTSTLLVGTLGQRTIAAVTSIHAIGGDGALDYGEAIGNVQVDVTYDNGDHGTVTLSEIIAAGFTVKIGSTEITDPTAATVNPVDHDGKELVISKAGNTDVKSTPVTVNKQDLTVTVDTTKTVEKVYNGTTAVEAADNFLKFADTTQFVGSDATTYAGITPTATLTYEDKNVAAGKALKWATLAAAGTDVDNFNKLYNLVADSAALEADGDVAGVTGEITKRPLTVSVITDVPSIIVDAEVLTGNSELALDQTNSDILKVGDNLDAVTLKYTYTYPNADAPTATTPINVTISGMTIEGTDARNYDLDETTPTSAAGTILPKTVGSVAVAANPTTMAYTYPNKTLSLAGMSINVTYDGTATPTPYTVAAFLESVNGSSVKLQDKEGNDVVIDSAPVMITKDNIDNICNLPYGEYKLVISVGSGTNAKTATLEGITAKRKEITIDDLELSFSKVFGSSEPAGEAKIKETSTNGEPVVEDGDNVTLEATFKPATENAGENIEVTVDLVLVGDDADNYVLVGEAGGETGGDGDGDGEGDGEEGIKIVIPNGTIEKADQDTPAVPVVTVDKYNNDLLIDLSGVNTEGLEYLVIAKSLLDASPAPDLETMDWFTADETTDPTSDYYNGYAEGQKTVPYYYNAEGKGDWALDTEYAVLVRVAETENYYASLYARKDDKTYPYEVRVFMVGSEEPVFGIFTNDAALDLATDDTTFSTNVLDGWLPSRFKAFYSDYEGTTLMGYENLEVTDGTLDVYYTRKRSSSSSGSTSLANTYTVTYDVDGKGIITENDKTEKVAVGKKPAEVPTVKAKDGYTFRGWTLDGEEIIDPTTVTINKDTTFKALYQVVEENEPIIDPKYIDPYATGYPDGSFQADKSLTRAELAAMIARIHYEGELPDNTYYASFEDIQPTDWYNKYIGYVEGLGVMNGYPDGTFQPTKPITRAEFASVLVRAQKYELFTSDDMFNDVAGHWAKDYITTLGNLKIVTGYENGTFLPENPLTRGEAVTMINRILEPSEIVGDNKPNDIAGHWAEEAITLAVNKRMLISEAPTEE